MIPSSDLFNKEYLQKLTASVVSSKKTEYSDQIGKFLEKLNPPRKASGYQEIRPVVLATTLQRVGIKPTQFHSLYKQCDLARDFSRMFWYIVKTKRLERRQLTLLK